IANTRLAGLTLSSGTLSPAFTSATQNYTVSVTNAVTSISMTAILADPNATATVNGTPVSSGLASPPISLPVGAKTISILVTGRDASTTRTYKVVVTRAPSNNAYLSAITVSGASLSPAFAPQTF